MKFAAGALRITISARIAARIFFRVKKFFIPPLCAANAHGRNRPFKVKKFFASLN